MAPRLRWTCKAPIRRHLKHIARRLQDSRQANCQGAQHVVREIVDNSSNETRTEITLDDILHSSGDMRHLQANLRRVKRRGVQTVPKDFMQEAFLQRFVEKAIRHLL
jgi:hypothetical protein